MKNPHRKPPTQLYYDPVRIQDGGILQEFGKTKKEREAAIRKRKQARKSRKKNRK